MTRKWFALFGCAVVLGLAGLVSAQEKPAKPDKPAREGEKTLKPGQLDSLKERLSLTDEQAAKVNELLQKQNEQLGALKKDAALTEEQKRAKMAEINRTTKDAIGALLTPEQKAKLDERQPGGKPGRDGVKDGMGERANNLAEKLGLTDDQKTKVAAIIQKQNDAVKAANKEAEDAIQALLTPEQKTKWEDLRRGEKKGKDMGDGAAKLAETPKPKDGAK